MGYNPDMATATATYVEIEDTTALQLPFPDRSKLATRLLESLDDDSGDDISPEWRDELRRRVAEMDGGRATLINGEQVWKQVNERFGTDFEV